MLGAVTVAAGYVLNIFLMAQIWQLVLVSCVIGAGVGLAYGGDACLGDGCRPGF